MFTDPCSVRLRAFAKINLGLRILGKRADGYHEIRTIYQTISLHDRLEISVYARGRSRALLHDTPEREELTLTPSPSPLWGEGGKRSAPGEGRRPGFSEQGISVACDEPSVPSGRDNLVYRACELWRRARKFRGGIEVRIEKKIPAGSGLGGASSDAAATLLGLERLTGDRLRPAARWKLAAKLGSDVPFFLWGGRALGCGHGEEVYPLADLPRRSCLVIFPGFSMPTAEAYREAGLQLTKGRRVHTIDNFGVWSQLPLDSWGPAENDFEGVVFAKWPKLARLKRQLIRAGAETASLTGSGSAVYALFNSAQKLSQAGREVPGNWLSFRTRTLSRAEYSRNWAIEPLSHLIPQ